LRSGTWGARGPAGAEGQEVEIFRRNGSSQHKRLGRCLWSEKGVALYQVNEEGKYFVVKSGNNVCAACGRRGSLVEDDEDGLMKHWSCCDIPPRR
jgi:hypothetical protein